jgi:hypothetical protein
MKSIGVYTTLCSRVNLQKKTWNFTSTVIIFLQPSGIMLNSTIAEEFPLDQEDGAQVSDDYNGLNGRAVNFADIGCGYGGLLCKFFKV